MGAPGCSIGGLGFHRSQFQHSARFRGVHLQFVGMFCNTTMVDQFSVPLSIQLDGAQSQTTGSIVPGGRDRILSGIAAQSGFASLVVANKMRVIAPGTGSKRGFSRRHITMGTSTMSGTNTPVRTSR